jgi:hypothetical protein
MRGVRRRAGALLLVAACLFGLIDLGAGARAAEVRDSGGAPLAQASNIDQETIQAYGKVLGLGARAPQFAAEIAVIRDAVARGDRAAAAAGIQVLYGKAGHLIPTGRAMDQLVSALPPAGKPQPTESGAAPARPVNPFAGTVGGGPTLPLGESPSTPPPSLPTPQKPDGSGASTDPFAGTVAGGPTLPLGESPSATQPSPSTPEKPVGGGASTNPVAGSTGGGPTLPLGQGSPPPPSATTSSVGSGSKPAGTSISDDSPLGPPPTPTVGLNPCGVTPPSSSDGPVTIGQVIGVWTDSNTGQQVEFERNSSLTGRADGVILRGKHAWYDVALQGQKLRACRMPQVEEMGEAPEWARQQAYGKIKWELELDVKADSGGQLTLEGKWYPGSYKWTEEPGPDSSGQPKRTVSDFGRGTPVDTKYTKPPPAISDVIVLTDQTAFVTSDKPKWPYASAGGDQRLLFIYGRSLPRSWSDKIEIKSEDPNISYLLIAMQAEHELHPARRELFETGWREAYNNLDADTIALTKRLDALLVYARMKTGVLPGVKRFTVNGADATWRLRFGDDRASISFMRAITEDVADPTSKLVLPERVFIEVRTGAAFPTDAIPLKVQVNDALVTWNGAKTLLARRVEPTVYRTATIELVESGHATPATEPGVFFLPVQLKDQIDVRLEDPFLFGVTPPTTVARVIRTPGELGETWKEALLRAAKADGITDFDDWGRLTASRATEIANYELTPVLLKVLDSATPLQFLRYVPPVYRYIEEAERGKLREKTPVTIGDHAALLLFRDQFVKSMTAAFDNLDQIKGEAALRGFREAIKLSAWDEDSPWRYLRVRCPGASSGSASTAQTSSGDCSFPYVVSDSFLERSFGQDKKAADQWVRQTVDEAIRNYRQAVKDAIAKAKAVEDKDVRELMKLVGTSYQPMLGALQARMLRLDEIGTPKRQLWIPDLNGRYEVRNLHTLIDAVQAQEDYSKLDTQMAMLMTAAMTAPFVLGEGVVAAAIAWATDTTFLGISLATDVPAFIEERQEIHFALGASIILGTQRLQEAEFKKTEWFQLVGQLGPGVLGPLASTARMIGEVGRMVGVVRTSLVLSAVEREGVKAFEELSAADKAAFWRYATEAELLQELGEVNALTPAHRRALQTTKKLFEELSLKVPELPKTKTLAATGESSALPKTKTLRERMPVEEETSVREAAADQGGSAKPGEETVGKNEPSAKPGEPPAKSPIPATEGTDAYGISDAAMRGGPKAGEKFRAFYNGKVREFELGKELGTDKAGKPKGAYARTFELVDAGIAGCERGCVIKILSPTYPKSWLFMHTGESVLRNIEAGAAIIGDDILTARTLRYEPTAPRPYYIQERLQPGDKVFEPGAVATYREFNNEPGLRKATLDLFRKLRQKGLIWEDCHVGNIFYRKVNGEWVAGIFDADRIIKFDVREGDLGAYMGWVESDHLGGKGSLSQSRPNSILDHDAMEVFFHQKPGPYYPDIDFFWEKILEAKGWIGYDPNIGAIGEYQQRYLFPSEVEQLFPRLKDPERLNGLDLTKQHWERSTFLRFRFAPRQFAYVPISDLLLAA